MPTDLLDLLERCSGCWRPAAEDEDENIKLL
jgi:hypothetical protein